MEATQQQKKEQRRKEQARVMKASPSNDRMLGFLQVVMEAGTAACASIGAVEAVQALMSATLNVALDQRRGGGMTHEEVVDWLHRLAAEVKASAPRAS